MYFRVRTFLNKLWLNRIMEPQIFVALPAACPLPGFLCCVRLGYHHGKETLPPVWILQPEHCPLTEPRLNFPTSAPWGEFTGCFPRSHQGFPAVPGPLLAAEISLGHENLRFPLTTRPQPSGKTWVQITQPILSYRSESSSCRAEIQLGCVSAGIKTRCLHLESILIVQCLWSIRC